MKGVQVRLQADGGAQPGEGEGRHQEEEAERGRRPGQSVQRQYSQGCHVGYSVATLAPHYIPVYLSTMLVTRQIQMFVHHCQNSKVGGKLMSSLSPRCPPPPTVLPGGTAWSTTFVNNNSMLLFFFLKREFTGEEGRGCPFRLGFRLSENLATLSEYPLPLLL